MQIVRVQKNNSEQRRGKADAKCYPNLNLYSTTTGMENGIYVYSSLCSGRNERACYCELPVVLSSTTYTLHNTRFSRAQLGFQCSCIV